MNDSIESQLIKALRKRRRPRILYHYTSGPGLVGILEASSIWSTNIRYLNDSTEYSLALKLTRDVLQDYVKKARNQFDLAVYKVLEERLSTDPPAEVYVTSFTENGDQLSQWRAYSPSTGGYAIGFRSKSLLRTNSSPQESFLAPCIYDSHGHGELIRRLINTVTSFAEDAHRTGQPHDRVYREAFKFFGRLLPIIAPILKDSSFAEEMEWRLVRLPASFDGEDPHFRAGRSMLIPYRNHSFSDTGVVPIEELVIGPTPHPKLAHSAAQGLLLSHGLAKASVQMSSIPYRTW